MKAWWLIGSTAVIWINLTASLGCSVADPFPAYKAHVLQIFQNCTLVYVMNPYEESPGLDTRAAAKKPWQVMTREIGQATKSWSIAGDPAARELSCQLGSNPQQTVEIRYLGGVVAIPDSPVGLKVGPAFRKALDELNVLSRQWRHRWAKDPKNPDSWPVNFEQAQAMGLALIRAAGIEPTNEVSMWADFQRSLTTRYILVEINESARVLVKVADGSILRAENSTLLPDHGVAINRTQALVAGRRIAATMGITGAPTIEKRTFPRSSQLAWHVRWTGPGREHAWIWLDADTGTFLAAGETMQHVHPMLPARATKTVSSFPPPPPAARLPKPGTVRVSAQQAKAIAGAFAKKNDLPFGTEAKVTYKEPEKNYRQPSTWEVTYFRRSSFQIDANTGTVYGFINWAAVGTGEYVPISEAVNEHIAKIAARRAAWAIGLSPDAVFAGVKPESSGDIGSWEVRWNRVTPEGVPFEDEPLYVWVWARTGEPWTATRLWFSPLPENRKATVTKEQAVEVAQQEAKKLRAEINPIVTIETVELKVVHLNKSGEKEVADKVRCDSPTRVAWAVKVAGGYTYWVDASTGKVIGREE